MFGPYDLRGLGVPRPLNTKTTIGSGSFWCRVPAGTNTSATIIWNPSDKPLPVTIKINSLKEVTTDIQPGANVQVDAPVDGTTVHMSFVADRRLVLLETTFKQK